LIIGQKSNIFLTDFLAEKKVLRNKSLEQKLRISINLTLYIQYLVTVTQSKCYEYTYTW
jgi:hypothetical protein